MATEVPMLGLRGYAKHRKAFGLPGATLSSVQKALADGRITRACSEHEDCPLSCSAGRIPPARADDQWLERTIRLDRSEEGARAELDRYKARLLALRIARETGVLVLKADVEAEALLAGQQVQKAMMQLCKRVAVRCASLTEPRVVQDYLEEEVRRALRKASVAIQRAPR